MSLTVYILYIRMATGEMDISEQLNSLPEMNKAALGALWREHFGIPPPEQTRRDLIIRAWPTKFWSKDLQERGTTLPRH
jgi:hypothetical protein